MPDPLPEHLEALAMVADFYRQAIEVASGHRRLAVEAGFCEEVAEQMALVAHNILLQSVVKGQS